MKKVVINKRYGGFGLSNKAVARLAELMGFQAVGNKERHLGDSVSWIHPTKGGFIEDFTREEQEDLIYVSGELQRDDPYLVQIVEELGDEANGFCSKLCIVEIPDDVKFEVEEYDGMEHIAEIHRTWG